MGNMHAPIEIPLTYEQLLEGGYPGLIRWAMACVERRKSIRPLGPNNQSAVEGDVLGTVAERAVHIWADEPWKMGGLAEFLARPRGDPPRDVRDWEVRATWRWDGHLILRPKDQKYAHLPFIFCTMEATPIVRIRGWAWGREVMVDELWNKDSWWMPQKMLRPCPDKPRPRGDRTLD